MMGKERLGATVLDGGRWRFEVWAPRAESVEVHLVGAEERRCAMGRQASGYFTTVLDNVPAGSRYLYRLQHADSTVLERPDPASRHQPGGVHEPSQVVTAAFDWQDQGWHGLPLDRYVIYELHVGTFSRRRDLCRRRPPPGRTGRSGRHGHRADADRPVPRRPQLGL